MKGFNMNLSSLTSKTSKIVSDNSPAILTAIGVSGLVATAYLTGKASFKAAEIISYDVGANPKWADEDPKTKDLFDLVWKLYIPAFGVGSMSVVAIVFANRIGTRRTAAMTAAYAITERAYSEYKDKVVETIGVNKEKKVRDEVAQDRVNALPKDQTIIVTGGGDQIFMDAYSGRTFMSTMEDVKQAQNKLNHEVLNQGYASLSDLYAHIGLSPTRFSDDVGWNSDKLMDMTFHTTFTDDMKSCVVVDFNVAPVRDFFRTR